MLLSVTEQVSGEAYTTLPSRARGQVRQSVAGSAPKGVRHQGAPGVITCDEHAPCVRLRLTPLSSRKLACSIALWELHGGFRCKVKPPAVPWSWLCRQALSTGVPAAETSTHLVSRSVRILHAESSDCHTCKKKVVDGIYLLYEVPGYDCNQYCFWCLFLSIMKRTHTQQPKHLHLTARRQSTRHEGVPKYPGAATRGR